MCLSSRSRSLCLVVLFCGTVSTVWASPHRAELSTATMSAAELSFLTATACAAAAPVVEVSALPMVFVPGSLDVGATDLQASSLSAAGAALTVGPQGELTLALAPVGDLGAAVVRIAFPPSARPRFEAVEPAGVTLHRLRGNNTSGWSRHDNGTYYALEAQEVWPGVELRLKGDGRWLDFRFEVGPGADPHQIGWSLPGREPGDVTARGDQLTVSLGSGDDRKLVWRQPRAWQPEVEESQPVAASYRSDGTEMGLRLDRFDPSTTLFVEVSLAFAPYLGVEGSAAADGSVFLTGQVPVSPPGLVPQGATGEASWGEAHRIDQDVLVAEIAPGGAALTSLTVIGGEGDDVGRALVASGTGSVLVAGTTGSADFPSAPRSPRESGASDGFVLELSSESGEILAAARLGGPAADSVHDLVQTAEGLHVVGRAGADFPSLDPERLSFSTWWPEVPSGGVVARRLSPRVETRYFVARFAPEGLEADAMLTFPAPSPLRRLEAWASCGDREVQVGLRPRPDLRNTAGEALPVCEAVTRGPGGAPEAEGRATVPETPEAELRNALAAACGGGGGGGSTRVPDTYEIEVAGFFTCPFISNGWGYHALCWKSRQWNVPYDAPTSEVPSGTVHSSDTGILNGFESNTEVFPENPPGSWYGRDSGSPAELVVGAALAMDRWRNPSYANVENGRQIALKKAVFDVDLSYEHLSELCDEAGWKDLGKREDVVARECISTKGGFFVLQEVTFDRWEGSSFTNNVSQDPLEFGRDYDEGDGTWITDPPSPEEGALVEELARRLRRKVLVRARAESVVRTEVRAGRVVAREMVPDGLDWLVRLDDVRRSPTPRRLATAETALSAAAEDSRAHPSSDVRSCGTPDPTPEVLASVEQRLRDMEPRLTVRSAPQSGRALRTTSGRALPPEEEPDEGSGSQEIVIPVVWHVIYDSFDGSGDLTYNDIDLMIRFINDTAFSLSDIRLDFWNVQWHDNPEWFLMQPGSPEERAAKGNRSDPHRFLNVYSTRLSGIGGFSSFPWQLTSQKELDGVVVNFDYLLGTDPPFDQGDALTHEIGHWLGLFHTYFPNKPGETVGCAYNCTTDCGDYVADTPPEAGPTFFSCPQDSSGQRLSGCQCPVDEDTCPRDFFYDAVENYMNNTDDYCRALFTSGQDDRMRTMIALYRSSLL